MIEKYCPVWKALGAEVAIARDDVVRLPQILSDTGEPGTIGRALFGDVDKAARDLDPERVFYCLEGRLGWTTSLEIRHTCPRTEGVLEQLDQNIEGYHHISDTALCKNQNAAIVPIPYAGTA